MSHIVGTKSNFNKAGPMKNKKNSSFKDKASFFFGHASWEIPQS